MALIPLMVQPSAVNPPITSHAPLRMGECKIWKTTQNTFNAHIPVWQDTQGTPKPQKKKIMKNTTPPTAVKTLMNEINFQIHFNQVASASKLIRYSFNPLCHKPWGFLVCHLQDIRDCKPTGNHLHNSFHELFKYWLRKFHPCQSGTWEKFNRANWELTPQCSQSEHHTEDP
jgi:hypothetical protein